MVDYESLDNGIKLYKVLFRNENIVIGILINIGSIFGDKEFRGISLDEKVKIRNVLP